MDFGVQIEHIWLNYKTKTVKPLLKLQNTLINVFNRFMSRWLWQWRFDDEDYEILICIFKQYQYYWKIKFITLLEDFYIESFYWCFIHFIDLPYSFLSIWKSLKYKVHKNAYLIQTNLFRISLFKNSILNTWKGTTDRSIV